MLSSYIKLCVPDACSEWVVNLCKKTATCPATARDSHWHPEFRHSNSKSSTKHCQPSELFSWNSWIFTCEFWKIALIWGSVIFHSFLLQILQHWRGSSGGHWKIQGHSSRAAHDKIFAQQPLLCFTHTLTCWFDRGMFKKFLCSPFIKFEQLFCNRKFQTKKIKLCKPRNSLTLIDRIEIYYAHGFDKDAISFHPRFSLS